MKIALNIACTPEEARAFFGLPDVKPMQEKLLKKVEAPLRANLQAMDSEAMLKTQLPAFKVLEDLLEKFISKMAQAAGAKTG